jgi:subtilisin family serine protease
VIRSLLGSAAVAAALVLAATSATAAPAQESGNSTAGEGDDRALQLRHQILVMIKEPPGHVSPNSSYGGSYGDSSGNAARRRLARGIAKRHGLELVDGWPMPSLGIDCFVMRVPDHRSVDDAIAQVSNDPMVAWSQPMQTYRAMAAPQLPNDPLFRMEPAARGWRLADLYRVSTGRGISIAVIDSRVQRDHPDLLGQVSIEQDFVGDRSRGAEDHGTAVAGVIAARRDNGIGISGIAPDARLMALRACWQTGGAGSAAPTFCSSLTIARALQFAIDHHARIINLSLAGPTDLLLGKLIDIAIAHDIIVVAAYDAQLARGGFPASKAGVIAVARDDLQVRPGGVYGAPGRDVPTTRPGGKWALVNGTSFAVAHVSGLVALMRERGRAVPGALVRLPDGDIDACASLLHTSTTCNCNCALDGRVAARSP